MAKHGKKYRAVREKVDRLRKYPLSEALELLKELHYANFDETVDVAYRLGVNPRHADQMVRGTVVLPHGLGKKIRVAVFAKGEKEKEAQEAGADFVGGEDLAKKIQDGWLDFDKAIATPDMMGIVGKLRRILGPRGMMPNPKVGTVTFDLARTIKEMKAGRLEFRVDKVGNIHAGIGKLSFGGEKIRENLLALTEEILRLKPASAKGTYMLNVALSTTMSPGVRIDAGELQNMART